MTTHTHAHAHTHILHNMQMNDKVRKILCNTFHPLEGVHQTNVFIDGIIHVGEGKI